MYIGIMREREKTTGTHVSITAAAVCGSGGSACDRLADVATTLLYACTPPTRLVLGGFTREGNVVLRHPIVS